MNTNEVELKSALETMRGRLEVHRYLLAIMFEALAQQLRDPNNLENPLGFLDRIENNIKVIGENEQLEKYIRDFFDLARSIAASGESQEK